MFQIGITKNSKSYKKNIISVSTKNVFFSTFCIKVKKSKKLIQLKVDIGTETRQVLAGIAESYEPENLIGRTVIIVANLKPAKLMGIESQGMVLAASKDGTISLAGFDQDCGQGIQVR